MPVAWIVQWKVLGSNAPFVELRPHILPYRWRGTRVLRYMKCLYFNSALYYPEESFELIKKVKPPGVIVCDEGRRMSYGSDSAILMAHYVKDLQFVPDKGGKFRMKWTEPPGWGYDQKLKRQIDIGEAVKCEYVP